MSDFVTIAIMAESGHGKDFCGRWIVQNQGFIDMAFADHIKRLCRTVFRAFSDEALWGEPALRNKEVPVDWEEARFRITWGLDDWLAQIGNLSIESRAEYKPMVLDWFERIHQWAFRGELLDPNVVKGSISPRIVLQLLGTEYGRAHDPTIWSGLLMRHMIPMIASGANDYGRFFGLMERSRSRPPINGVVITDCRYLSEMEDVQAEGGYVIKVIRNSKKGKENEAELAGIKGHSSEVELRSIPHDRFDQVLEMDDGAENVYPVLQKMFEERLFENARK